MKQLLTFGCSFTDGERGVGWPNRLAELMGRELTNYGKGSAGNFYISNKVVEAVSKLEEQDVYVVVMWSGIDREDLVVSKYEHNFTNEEAMELGYTDTDITNASGNWFHSGGLPIPEPTKRSLSLTDYVSGSRFFEWFWGTFFKNYHTFENSYLKSLKPWFSKSLSLRTEERSPVSFVKCQIFKKLSISCYNPGSLLKLRTRKVSILGIGALSNIRAPIPSRKLCQVSDL